MTAPEREALVKALLDEAADLRNAPAGDAKDEQHNYNWADKPHRCLYDACALVERAVAALSNAPAVTVTEEMVEAFLNSWFPEGWEDFAPMYKADCRAALQAALKSTTPQTGSQE